MQAATSPPKLLLPCLAVSSSAARRFHWEERNHLRAVAIQWSQSNKTFAKLKVVFDDVDLE